MIGQSEVTANKQYQFQEIIQTHISIVKAIVSNPNKAQYWADECLYIDAYSGNGLCESGPNMMGSALILLDALKHSGIKSKVVLIEHDSKTCDELKINTSRYSSNLLDLEIWNADNSDVLADLSRRPFPKKPLGMLYLDPNGVPGFEPAKRFLSLRQFGKIDLLVNCPCTAVKRTCSNVKCSNTSKVAEHLVGIDKCFWLVREQIGKWQWSFLLGTNWHAFPEFSHLNCRKITTPEGRAILEDITYTADDKKRFRSEGHYQTYEEFMLHPFTRLTIKEVFGIAPKIYGKPQCAICKCNPATEPHHLRYPSWDSKNDVLIGFDSPQDILPVCRKCHALQHGKEK